MRTMSATIQIDAAPMRVWAILTDLSRSPEWNPLFRSAAGEVTLTRPGSAHPRRYGRVNAWFSEKTSGGSSPFWWRMPRSPL